MRFGQIRPIKSNKKHWESLKFHWLHCQQKKKKKKSPTRTQRIPNPLPYFSAYTLFKSIQVVTLWVRYHNKMLLHCHVFMQLSRGRKFPCFKNVFKVRQTRVRWACFCLLFMVKCMHLSSGEYELKGICISQQLKKNWRKGEKLGSVLHSKIPLLNFENCEKQKNFFFPLSKQMNSSCLWKKTINSLIN